MRLFIAVELGEAVVNEAQAAIARLTPQAPNAKWARVEGLHLTLAFLGEMAPDQLPALQAALEAVAARHGPVALTVAGGGSFGSARHPRVLWAGFSGEVEALARIQADLTAQLIPLGYQPEARDFRPHLTLARSRDPRGDAHLAACAEALADSRFGEAWVQELVLFQSQLSPHGAHYTVLARIPLTGRR